LAQKKVQATGSVEQLRELVGSCTQLSIRRQCEILGIARSGVYYEPCPETEENLVLMRRLDELHLEHPVYGSRRLVFLLRREGCSVNRKRVCRLLQVMGIEAIYPRRWTSQPGVGHRVYSYLLEDLDISGPDQVWCSDITYIPMQKGFMYLVAVMDWWSRFVLAWELSNTLDPDFCVRAWEQALAVGTRPPRISNTDQGAQFTSESFLEAVESAGVDVSMDGRGRWVDNRFIERLWRSVKYEDIYLQDYLDGLEAGRGLSRYFTHYNTQRPHQALAGATPADLYRDPAAYGARPPKWDTSSY
jgi:putative transposase